ncbi:hypothetical protein NKH28_31510 [Mesorhizobium sp. M1227]|uniref:hypothetical protein n=1 Tax=Mesorhizobium sp. M1227 TaxID=2957071 RepID=UPI003339B1F0
MRALAVAKNRTPALKSRRTAATARSTPPRARLDIGDHFTTDFKEAAPALKFETRAFIDGKYIEAASARPSRPSIRPM